MINVIEWVILGFIAIIIGFIGYMFAQERAIECYYTTAKYAPAYGVKADIPWASDPVVFKANTIQELSMYLSSVKVCGMREPGNRA